MNLVRAMTFFSCLSSWLVFASAVAQASASGQPAQGRDKAVPAAPAGSDKKGASSQYSQHSGYPKVALGFTDNGPYGTPARERTEKKFALILPFGIGQFVQERYVAGSSFLLAEVGLLTLSYLSYENGQTANRQERDYIATNCPTDSGQCNPRQLDRYRSVVRSADQAMLLFGFSALGTMIGGAVDAVLHERKWSLKIALAPPSRLPAPNAEVPGLDPWASSTGGRMNPALVLDLKRLL